MWMRAQGKSDQKLSRKECLDIACSILACQKSSCLTSILSLDPIQALLNSLDDTSSIEDVFECLAACPQLCSEERRELADNMEPITKPIHKRLAARGAGPLRSSPAPSSTSRKASRSGKSKGSSKAKHANSGGNRHDKVDGEQQAVQGDGVEEEFYSRGRRGEGNRRTTRSQPELSNVVTHNLVVLMSALFHERVSSGDGVAGEDGNASEEGDTSAATTSSTVERDGEGGADIRSASALGADEVKGNVGDSAIGTHFTCGKLVRTCSSASSYYSCVCNIAGVTLCRHFEMLLAI